MLDALKVLFPAGTSIPTDAEATARVVHRRQVVPDVPLCDGAADAAGGASGGSAAG